MTEKNIYLLTLLGFEAMPLIEMMAYWHHQNNVPKVLGLSAHLIEGEYRMCIYPDATIEHMPSTKNDIVIVPPTQRYEIVLTDPRIHIYLQGVLQMGGRIVLLGNIGGKLARLGFPSVAYAKQVITPTEQAVSIWGGALLQKEVSE